MRKLLMAVCLAATFALVRAESPTQVSGVINGEQVQFSPEVRQKLLEESVTLLASCGYSDSRSKKGLADAKRGSYLHFALTKALIVEVPLEKIKVELKEMVITLPLSSGRIWVNSNEGALYLAKFDPKLVNDNYSFPAATIKTFQ